MGPSAAEYLLRARPLRSAIRIWICPGNGNTSRIPQSPYHLEAPLGRLRPLFSGRVWPVQNPESDGPAYPRYPPPLAREPGCVHSLGLECLLFVRITALAFACCSSIAELDLG